MPIASYTVDVLTYDDSGEDTHGNPTDTWGAGVSQSVYGWAPAGSAEPFEAGRDPVTSDLDLLVPPAFTCAPRDRVVVATLTYEVEGVEQDFTHGPYGYQPGGVVRLRRVEG